MLKLTESQINEYSQQVQKEGWCIVEDVIEEDFIDEIKFELDNLVKELQIAPSNNLFEGVNTTRVYNLLAHGAVFEKIPLYLDVLSIVEKVLDPGLLISSLSSIAIGPGETAQPIHSDDQLIPIPKPHPPIICNTMWAITDFTAENGATRLIPKTHLLDHSPDPFQSYDTVAAEMKKGSVLIWVGSLWHGGGANKTDQTRIGIAMNYCAGYIRQQENQQIGIPLEKIKSFPIRLQELVGFSIYNGLIGHINKLDPKKVVLQEDVDTNLIWDYAKVDNPNA